MARHDHELHEQRRAQRRVERALRKTLCGPLSLVWTDNVRCMLSVRVLHGVPRVRLHRIFARAPDAVLDAVPRYIHGDRDARAVIQRFVARAAPRPSPTSPARPLRARGDVHDLEAILAELSRRYFNDAVRLPIGWSRRGYARRTHGRRTIRLGVYLVHEQMIRVHPALDQSWVPRGLVEWVVFHEMLHHVVPIARHNGRRALHSAEFRAREAAFDGHAHAVRWIEQNLPRLLASRALARGRDAEACRPHTGAVDVAARR